MDIYFNGKRGNLIHCSPEIKRINHISGGPSKPISRVLSKEFKINFFIETEPPIIYPIDVMDKSFVFAGIKYFPLSMVTHVKKPILLVITAKRLENSKVNNHPFTKIFT
jgi:hypothetical protein